ncbi:MAG: hypothetical protein FWB80_00080 [Defluviitaleaceae bacterium]|nr:hypothetical protein [Defluviitaleaceae bacterium]
MLPDLRNFQKNPDCPKNVQISFITFLSIEIFLDKVDEAKLSTEEQLAFSHIKKELLHKKSRISNRQAYTEITRAKTKDEKQAAYENYLFTKQLSK